MVLTAFTGVLALGSWLAGRVAHRVRRPLLAFGLLDLAIGAYALLLPGLLRWLEPGLGWLAGHSFAVLSPGRFALATALLLVPTACMGATLPILAQHVTRAVINTAGCIVGALPTGSC